MPIPFLVGAAAVIAAKTAAGASAKIKQDVQQANALNNEAKNIIESAQQQLSYLYEDNSNVLMKIGNLKLQIWSDELLDAVEILEYTPYGQNFDIENMKEKCINGKILRESGNIDKTILVGIAGLGAEEFFLPGQEGSLIDIETAMTGNNTLAWFGGSSSVAVATGATLLGGSILSPIMAISALALNKKSKEEVLHATANLEEARNFKLEAETTIHKLTAMKEVLTNFYTALNRQKDRLMFAIEDYSEDQDNDVLLQKLLNHTKLLNGMLNISLFTNDGEISKELTRILYNLENQQEPNFEDHSVHNSDVPPGNASGELKLYEKEIDHRLLQLKQTPNLINGDVEGIMQLLSVNEKNLTKVESQGWFKRIWGTVSGGNKRLEKINAKNLQIVQQLSLSLISKLEEQNMITREIITMMNGKINELAYGQLELKQFIEAVINRVADRFERVEDRIFNVESHTNFQYLLKEVEKGFYNDYPTTIALLKLTYELLQVGKLNEQQTRLLEHYVEEAKIITEDTRALSAYLIEVGNITGEEQEVLSEQLIPVLMAVSHPVCHALGNALAFGMEDLKKRKFLRFDHKLKEIDQEIDTSIDVSSHELFEILIESIQEA